MVVLFNKFTMVQQMLQVEVVVLVLLLTVDLVAVVLDLLEIQGELVLVVTEDIATKVVMVELDMSSHVVR